MTLQTSLFLSRLCPTALRLTAALLLLGFAVGGARASEWTLLGERTVRNTLDHDTIAVTVARGDFRRLKFVVRYHAIRMIRMMVHYGDGAPDKKETRWLIPAGGESRVIDLRGGDRLIRRVDFWYDTASLSGQRALIRLYAAR
jgi:hypothetical protein